MYSMTLPGLTGFNPLEQSYGMSGGCCCGPMASARLGDFNPMGTGPSMVNPLESQMRTVAMMQQMMGMLIQLMSGQQANGAQSPSSLADAGAASSASPISGVSSSAPNSASAASGSSSAASIPGGPVGQGQQAAVDLGRRFLGQNSIDIKGKLSHFTAAGGQTNNCADFVSSLLESTGQLKGHHVGVRDLESALKSQGYRQIPAAQSKPGDVWISKTRSHTEMVTQAGGGKCIGSNNDRPGHQVISEKPMDLNRGIYYTKG